MRARSLVVLVMVGVSAAVAACSLLPGSPVPAAPVPALTTDRPAVTITPSTELRDGQVVMVRVTGFGIGGKAWLSECASAAAATDLGCGAELAAQPFLVTDENGAGSATFVVRGSAQGKPLAAGPAVPCADRCVVVVTIGGGFDFVVAPISFAAP